MLWEDTFYEDGVSISDRIGQLVQKIRPETVANIAIDARRKSKLRHVPLLLLVHLAKIASGSSLVSSTTEKIIQRADEIPELLALYWKINPPVGGKRRPIPNQIKKGLAAAFAKFQPYHFAKYDRDNAVKIRDVMFLVHPKPLPGREALYAQIASRTVPPADTWEVALSSGADKKETWTRLILEGKLGYLALLRNLRNMEAALVDDALVREAILARKGADMVLPFRYIAAARAAPSFEKELDAAMLESIAGLEPFDGMTNILVDISGSMRVPLSAKSDMTRMDAAAALAALFPGAKRVFSFSTDIKLVPPRGGIAMIDAIIGSQMHGGTDLFGAVRKVRDKHPNDRLLVITDEQTTRDRFDTAHEKMGKRSYLVNVAPYQNGVGYGADWIHIDGFSESVIGFMQQMERSST
jgi:hypothetical protein